LAPIVVTSPIESRRTDHYDHDDDAITLITNAAQFNYRRPNVAKSL